MQKARIRTSWKNKSRQISVEEFANAVSSICWRISLNAAKNLHQQDFEYANDSQRLGVMGEYLFFFIHCSDRLLFASLSHAQRGEFVNTLSLHCKRHYLQNAREILPSDLVPDSFIEQLNEATSHMADTQFNENQPGFDMYRYLGNQIQQIMGHSQVNKWVIDQIMDIDGPNAYDIFKKSFDKLKRSSGF